MAATKHLFLKKSNFLGKRQKTNVCAVLNTSVEKSSLCKSSKKGHLVVLQSLKDSDNRAS